MRRRSFLGGLAAGFSSIAMPLPAIPDSELILPPRLREGGTVGVIAPSTGVTDPDSIDRAARTLDHFGLKGKWGKTIGKRISTHAVHVRERLDDLHAMFADPEVNAVFAIGGGFGTSHLLDGIDYGLIRRNPKIFTGYSDITALHLAIHKRAGLVTFHSPVLLSAFTPYTEAQFRKVLFEAKAAGPLTNPPESNTLRPAHRLRVIRPGKARGRLIGGNLSLIAATMGTPFEIETAGKLLFLEDVDEQPYSLDRMLSQLRLAGKLQQAAGLVFGECADCRPRDFKPATASVFSFGETLDNLLQPLGIPVLSGLTIGHTADQLTLPLGIEASLDTAAGTVTIEQPAVR